MKNKNHHHHAHTASKHPQKHDINQDLAASAEEVAKTKEAYTGRYSGPDSSYSLAFSDNEFLTRHETRGLRFQMEIMKPDLVLRDEGIKHTIVVFGSARFPSPEEAADITAAAKTDAEIKAAKIATKQATYYKLAYDFGRIVAERNITLPIDERLHILTGGGPGIMAAALKFPWSVGDKTIGMNIALPFEQEPNPYITPKLCFNFHYFASRKLNLLSGGSSTKGRILTKGKGMGDVSHSGGGACSIVACPGGLGTLDEMFDKALKTFKSFISYCFLPKQCFV